MTSPKPPPEDATERVRAELAALNLLADRGVDVSAAALKLGGELGRDILSGKAAIKNSDELREPRRSIDLEGSG